MSAKTLDDKSSPSTSVQCNPSAGLDPEAAIDPSTRPHSAFSSVQKRWITYAISTCAMFSGLSSFIYYPAISSLSTSLRTSVGLINLTITSYLIVAGLAPSITGDLADTTGRRPVYLLTIGIYFLSNVGLALQRNYAALLVLRMVQSFGSSGTLAIAYGVIADISIPSERGTYVGVLATFTNSAPSLGPILGGILSQKLGWPAVFWLLAATSGLLWASLILCFPESSRRIVGDGSISPHGIYRPFFTVLKGVIIKSETQESNDFKFKWRTPNPLTSLKLLWRKDTAAIVVTGSIFYTIFGTLGASLSVQGIRIYHLDYLQAGLLYIPCGVGGMISGFGTGKLLNRDYRVTANKYEIVINHIAGDDMKTFPIEKARLRSSLYAIGLNVVATLGYGWALHFQAHLAVPLVFQFVTGLSSVCLFGMCSSLLTDLNTGRSSTAQASYNLVRCSMGAAGVAVLQPLINGIGVGWSFTCYAGLCLSTVPLVLMLRSRIPREYPNSSSPADIGGNIVLKEGVVVHNQS